MHCECCPRKCGVNRLEGKTGFCRIAGDALISYAGLHFGEEPPISGTRGSGTIFFAGCNLRCVFCQNYQISQEFQASQMQTLTAETLAAEMLRLQGRGSQHQPGLAFSRDLSGGRRHRRGRRTRAWRFPSCTIPTGTIPWMRCGRCAGLSISICRISSTSPMIWPGDTRRRRLCRHHPRRAPEMLEQVGHLELDDDGIARRGLLVRHLVLPGAVDNSRQCLALLAELSPATHVSIMSQYSPQYRAARHPEINRPLTAREYDEVTDYAVELGLENAFIQELDSRHRYLPDFNLDRPFE